MSIKEQGGALHWSWRGMLATLAHRHYETFELPEFPNRQLPDRLAITFLTNREGNIVSLRHRLSPWSGMSSSRVLQPATVPTRLSAHAASVFSRAARRSIA
jgi:hypothetical protein